MPEQKTLAVAHALNPSELENAERLGGLPCPSLAVVAVDEGIGPYLDRFGTITLLLDPATADPRSTPVFTGDVYSDRFPEVYFDRVPAARRKRFLQSFEQYEELLGENLETQLAHALSCRRGPGPARRGAVNTATRPDFDRIVSRLSSSLAGMARFWDEHDMGELPVALKSRGLPSALEFLRDPEFQAFLEANPAPLDVHQMTAHEVARFGEAVRAAIVDFYTPAGNATNSESEAVLFVRETALESSFEDGGNGPLKTGELERLAKAVFDADDVLIDKERTRAAFESRIDREAYEYWCREQARRVCGEPSIQLNGKRTPLTLKNIMRKMTAGRIAGTEERMSYGDGYLASKFIRRLTSVSDLVDEAAVQLASGGQQGQAHLKETQEAASAALATYRHGILKETADWAAHRDVTDTAMEALASLRSLRGGDSSAALRQVLERRFPGATISDETITAGLSGLTALTTADRPYFEAKPQFAVEMPDIRGAIVPDTLYKAHRDILEAHDVPYVVYETDNPELHWPEARRLASIELCQQLEAAGVNVYLDRPIPPSNLQQLTGEVVQQSRGAVPG